MNIYKLYTHYALTHVSEQMSTISVKFLNFIIFIYILTYIMFN